jgi:hypothetical protein
MQNIDFQPFSFGDICKTTHISASERCTFGDINLGQFKQKINFHRCAVFSTLDIQPAVLILSFKKKQYVKQKNSSVRH